MENERPKTNLPYGFSAIESVKDVSILGCRNNRRNDSNFSFEIAHRESNRDAGFPIRFAIRFPRP